jgi:hypothetical protein
MTDIQLITRDGATCSKQQQRAPNCLLRKTIRQLNSIGIYDGATMKAVYARRLKAGEPQLAVAA